MNGALKPKWLWHEFKRMSGCACSMVLIAGFLLAGCAAPKQSFLHKSHRSVYGIGDEEIQKLQFYTQRAVLAHAISADGTVSAEDVVIVPAHTPGVVKEVGPHWLRVAFQPGGSGVIFLASDRNEDSVYKLATEVEGKSGYYRLEGMRDPILLYDGRRYRIIDGAGNYLQISQKEFDQIVKSREHVKGVRQ